MTIHCGETHLVAPYTYTLQLEDWEIYNVPHMRSQSFAESYFIEKRAIVQCMGIGLTSADMPIMKMLGDG